ncbi:hypothetical protein [Amycolatopsis lexingtonensis]|uniref:hypothetical protein n=1 Tax=Amycolatopsis lexingtonensis TaxID=218822 RepID=UPI003F6ECE1C
MLYEIDSAEQRDRYVTARGEQTEPARQFWARHPEAEAVLARWRRLGTFAEHRIDDYPDWRFHVLKGERGNRLDQYVMMMEIASLEDPA